jgi:hypothetical protein
MADVVGDAVKCLNWKGKPAVGIGMPTARAPGSEDARDQGVVSYYLVLPFIITVTHRGRRGAPMARRDDREY